TSLKRTAVWYSYSATPKPSRSTLFSSTRRNSSRWPGCRRSATSWSARLNAGIIDEYERARGCKRRNRALGLSRGGSSTSSSDRQRRSGDDFDGVGAARSAAAASRGRTSGAARDSRRQDATDAAGAHVHR